MDAQAPGECPADEEVQALVEGSISSQQRADLMQHLGTCDRCCEWVAALLSDGSADTTIRLGRYELGQGLGAGGMGLVYRAYDPVLGRDVAIKLIQGEDVSEAQRERLLSEARTLAGLSHPNIVSVFDAGSADGELYYAMEVLDGATLRDWAQEQSWQSLVRAGVGLARALAAVHERGIIHRDIKPENIVVVDDARPVLVDFGLAQTRSVADGAGTVGYMAPELLEGFPPSAKSDQFALAMTLYETLSADSKGQVPASLRRTLAMSMADSPDERFPDMRVFAEALEASTRRPRRMWWVAGTLAVAALGVALLLGGQSDDAGCSEWSRSLKPEWEDRRAELIANLGVLELELGDRDARASRFVEGWQQERRALCESPPAESLALQHAGRVACLEGLRSDFGTTLDLMADSDADLAAHGLRMLNLMTPPEFCARESAVSLAVPLTPSEESAELGKMLAKLAAMREASRATEAAPLIARARTLADSLAHPPSLGRLHLLEGRFANARGDFEGAISLARDSIEAYERGGDDLGRGEALVFLCGIHAESKLHTEKTASEVAKDYCTRAEALVQRLKVPWLEADFHDSMGLLHLSLGDHASARESFEQALIALIENFGEKDRRVLAVLNNLGAITVNQQDWQAASKYMERTYELARKVHGAEHTSTAIAQAQWGAAVIGLGDFDHGDAMLASANEVFIKLTGADSVYVLTTHVNRCQARLNQEDYSKALPICGEALSTAKARGDRLGDHQVRLAEAQSELGGPLAEEAIANLEAAIATLEPEGYMSFTGHYGLARYRLALLLRAGGKWVPRIGELASEGREYLLGPRFEGKYDEWISSHWDELTPR